MCGIERNCAELCGREMSGNERKCPEMGAEMPGNGRKCVIVEGVYIGIGPDRMRSGCDPGRIGCDPDVIRR